jgi:hypothetical protein
MSTTFSRKIRFSQLSEKHLKNQRDFALPTVSRASRRRLGAATTLTYRFACQASSLDGAPRRGGSPR